ncbi:DUF305 domain-containing protein [Saccharopolyspora erythraea]|uniref:DUF305 domain-containing protein n=1 Tax=Saccharopolyspora erythraea TaxID=1836 RepID=UPI001BAD7849|nr:DUF305 domain-containing protein [Saccharopolyspora erythraea]QUH03450.1 DUF305 domain-containing protein [Saccharopolyspora erythraea]
MSARGPALRSVLVLALCVSAGLLVAAGALLLATPDREEDPRPGPVDIGFSQDMSAHHAQAAEMAGLARERSADPAVRALAVEIETSELEQAGRMRGWLQLWNQPETPPGGHHMAWMDPQGGHAAHGQAPESSPHGGTPGAPGLMPGMASPAEVDRLRAATGAEFDTFFLQLMVRHHQSGLPMLREAVDRAATPQVRELAQHMIQQQGQEIATMAQLLQDRGAEQLPTPN